MSDIFDDLNKIFKKDLVPFFFKYFKDPNNKINENLNDFLNESQASLTDIFEKISKNKDNYNIQRNYTDIQNITDIEPVVDDEYDELFKRLTLIEDNMIQIENILKNKN